MNRLTEQFFGSSNSVFTQADVSSAIAGTDYSRHGLVKRAMAAGEILNIRRGLYCLARRYQTKPVSVFGLAQRVHGPSYISLETALSYHGWIPEAIRACTCAAYRSSREYDTPLGLFTYRRVPQRAFYSEVERRKDESGNVFFMASPAKALADYIYAERRDWTGIAEAAASLRIDTQDWESVEPRELADLVENYRSRRVKRFLASWKEALEP
jgi:hypothetical protein